MVWGDKRDLREGWKSALSSAHPPFNQTTDNLEVQCSEHRLRVHCTEQSKWNKISVLKSSVELCTEVCFRLFT
jgi:hypothetical protein